MKERTWRILIFIFIVYLIILAPLLAFTFFTYYTAPYFVLALLLVLAGILLFAVSISAGIQQYITEKTARALAKWAGAEDGKENHFILKLRLVKGKTTKKLRAEEGAERIELEK